MQQRPLTSIADSTAKLDDITFPSITICNANQVVKEQGKGETLSRFIYSYIQYSKVKKSIIRRANATGDLSRYDVKYLINHYLTGKEMAAPKNVASLLNTVKQKLKLDTTSGGDTFNKVVAQVKLHDNRKH